jgi:hypothetical protein
MHPNSVSRILTLRITYRTVSLKLAEVDSSPIRYRHFCGNAAPVEARHGHVHL